MVIKEDCRLGLGYRGSKGDERTMKERKIKIEKERKRIFIPSGLYKIYRLGRVD